MLSLLAFCLLAPDVEAEAAFRKIERTLSEAKSIRIRFTTDGVNVLGGVRIEYKGGGRLLLKTGNKTNVWLSTKAWYEPNPFKLSRLAATLKTDAVENAGSETYAEFVLDGEIADKEFTLPEEKAQEKPAKQDDLADVPSQELQAGGDADKKYFLIGPKKDAPEPAGGYSLLLVLPGGDGSAAFHPFVKRIFKFALPERYLVAQLVAVDWTGGDANRTVWPTARLRPPKAKFTTEQFVDAVVTEVAAKHKINPSTVFTLSWSSGGPAAYAASIAPKSRITGSFVAMSVFRTEWLGALDGAKEHAYYLFQSPDDKICPLPHAEKARDTLQPLGAKVELVEYAGGHGWHGPVFPNIRKGITWLEQNRVERK